MIYEWDETKNRAKHGLDFADAEQVLSGACVTFADDRFDCEEERTITLGLLAGPGSYYCPRAARRRYYADYLLEKGKST